MLLLVGHATRAILWNERLGGCVPPWRVTFDPSHVLLWAWQKVKGEALSVYVADYRYWNLPAAAPRP